jgi:hypothetical protein
MYTVWIVEFLNSGIIARVYVQYITTWVAYKNQIVQANNNTFFCKVYLSDIFRVRQT